MILEGSQLPEAIVEQVLTQIPWEKLTSDSAQQNWFNICMSHVPLMVAGPTPNLPAPPVSTPQSLPVLALPDSMEKTPNHQVQGAVSDPKDMDTDRNPETITMGKGGCLTSGMKGTPDEPQLELGRHSTWLSSMSKAAEGGQEHTIC